MGDIESSQVAPLRVIDLRVMNVLADSPNIFHVFALEVNRVFQLTVEAIECDWAVLIQPTHRSIWRGFVLSGLLPVFCDESEIDRDYVLVSLPPLDSESWLVDPHQFLCYPTSSMWRAMVRRILVRHEFCSEADHLIDVVFVKRLSSRILLDSGSSNPVELLLESACRARNLSFQVAAFEQMSPLDQIALMRQTRLLVGVHGAGLTNLVFCRTLRLSSKLISLNIGRVILFVRIIFLAVFRSDKSVSTRSLITKPTFITWQACLARIMSRSVLME